MNLKFQISRREGWTTEVQDLCCGGVLDLTPLHTLKTLSNSLLSYKVSANKTADSLMGVPFDVMRLSSLAAVKLSLSLIFKVFISVCLHEVLFG